MHFEPQQQKYPALDISEYLMKDMSPHFRPSSNPINLNVHPI